MEAVVVGRASPAGCADEDVHNPSVNGLSTSWGCGCSRRRIHPLLRGGTRRGGFGDGLKCESGRSKVDGFRLSAFFESALCFDVAVEWSSLLHLLCRAFDRFIGRG